MRWLASITLLSLATTVVAQEWPRFRGPNGNGSGEANVPLQWSEKDFAWKDRHPRRRPFQPGHLGRRGSSSPPAIARPASASSWPLNAADGKVLWTKDLRRQALRHAPAQQRGHRHAGRRCGTSLRQLRHAGPVPGGRPGSSGQGNLASRPGPVQLAARLRHVAGGLRGPADRAQ